MKLRMRPELTDIMTYQNFILVSDIPVRTEVIDDV